MRKRHFGTVQRMAGNSVVMSAVEGIAGKWVAKRGKMYPDLVGAACFQPNADHGVGITPADDGIMGDSMLTIGIWFAQNDGAFYPSDRNGDGAGIIWKDTFDNGNVLFFYGSDEQPGT